MRRLAPALAGLALLAACSGSESPPDVAWGNYPTNQRQAVRDAVAAEDCTKMQTMFDGTEGADLLDYLDWQMRQAGCY